MNIIYLFFQRHVKKIQRSRLRQMMRGYRAIKQSGRTGIISKVKEALTEQSLGLTVKHFSSYLMGVNGYLVGEIVVRQYLLLRIGGFNLNQALLFALGKRGGKVIYPLPKEWRVTISQHGFKVANIRSSFLWQLYIFGAWLFGIFQIVKIILSSFISLISKPIKPKKHIYFANLSSGNLPPIDSSQKSYDIASWYLQWKGNIKNIGAIHHSVSNASTKLIGDVDLVFQQDILPSLSGLKVVFSYAFWGIIASFIALLDCFRGRWWHALILNQAALSKQVRCLQSEFLADEYLFHNSVWIYRPLWTYDAEKIGSKITFYFYSTNCESFKAHDGYQPIPYGWKAMNWSRYLVWDKYQADFIRRSVDGKANIANVGPIWFQDSNKKIPVCKGRKIAVFDVTPVRKSFYCTLGLSEEFYTPDIVNKFLEDIVLLAEKNYSILWKRKRNIGTSAHPLYRSLVNRLDMLKGVVLIDSEISAVKVIEQSDIVISIPFTSTALIARSLGKASAYYDPTGMIAKNDVAGHGIPLLSNYKELFHWVSEVCDEKKIN